MFANDIKDTFWSSIEERLLPNQTKSLKFSCSSDFSLAYIDFIDLKKERVNYSGPILPLIAYLSGTGTFYSPFALNDEDPLVKSIALLGHARLRKPY